jgi:hypothetical protein
MDATTQSAESRQRRRAQALRLLGVLTALVLLATPTAAAADLGGAPDWHAASGQLIGGAPPSLASPPADPAPPADPGPAVDPPPAESVPPAESLPPAESVPPADPAPVEPAPVEPAPADPAPVEPAPVEPAPVEPAPVDPAPVDPPPADPAPLDPEPRPPLKTEPAPSQPAPAPLVVAPPSVATAPPSVATALEPEPTPETETAAQGTTESTRVVDALTTLGIEHAAPSATDLVGAVAAATAQSCAPAIPVGAAAPPEGASALADHATVRRHGAGEEPPRQRGPPVPFDPPFAPDATSGAPAGTTSGQGGADHCALVADALALQLSGVEILVAPQHVVHAAPATADLAARGPPVA